MKVFIGIGSNLGDRQANIEKAINYLRDTDGIIVDKVSSLIETKPHQACGPDYLNAALKIETEKSPQELLKILQDIENNLGRKRVFKNSPRTIDLDILLYADLVIDEPGLKIPHPQMQNREFVTRPLSEIKDDCS